jgi:hypothetical protein
MGRGGCAILARPRVHDVEQHFVGGEDVFVGQRLLRREFRERSIEAGREGGVLHLPNDFRVLGSRGVAQIAAGVEITERIECHGLVSRR